MAPTGIPPSSPNQPSSEHTTKPETAQSQPTDPATASHLQWTVKGSNELTDPSTDEVLRKAASEDNIPTEIFMPVPFVAKREESEASKK
ncbi:hypothetical protein NA56DRAFT_703781 [Hyaloscypha hepaticicola]|uniref:Uncharacterized protein n=1 Tax=Hyaloscypha hepaticicola TaxID=2082293 RepID=A0A2J6Q4K2_9HELO|nr:hypothetical protein NA56DRAFT_703781 [Hyaloscypha hepaticicola]